MHEFIRYVSNSRYQEEINQVRYTIPKVLISSLKAKKKLQSF